ncbi:MAG: mraZ, partial [Acidimicrobiales bacterium]|nr:mraZ [Acidimicrobiales bacterium]
GRYGKPGPCEAAISGGSERDQPTVQKFLGVFERQLDVKGRLALPAPFRARLGTNCYLTLGADNSIEVFTAERFEQEADRIQSLQERGEISMDRLRAFSARAVPVEPDAQGRIYLDERLRNHANLTTKGPAVVFGRLDRIEICSVERHERSMRNGEQAFSESNNG